MAIKSIEITNLTNNQLYGFRMFPRNLKGQYQTRDDKGTATATPKAGISVSNLPVGTLIKDVNTKYYNQPIVWKIADQNHTGYPVNSTTLISNKILTLKCFDGKEPNNSDTNRSKYGNNRYSVSNIRQWLNSNDSSGQWYSPQHSADAPPNSLNANFNPYELEPGFCNSKINININFYNITVDTTIKTVIPNVDGGGSENIAGQRFFLASSTEVGLPNENNIPEGFNLALFSDNSSRICTVTNECVSNSDHEENPSPGDVWWWRLRTPYHTLSDSSHLVYFDGTKLSGSTRSGHYGIRPLCNIKNDTFVSLQPDTDGAYIIQF